MQFTEEIMHKQIKEQIMESISVKELTLDSCINDIGSAAEIMIASIGMVERYYGVETVVVQEMPSI